MPFYSSELISESGRVLVVDDESGIRCILRCNLEENGFEVDEAENGHTALLMLDQAPERYDLVLLDRVMPGADGIHVLRALRHDNRFRFLPVILQITRINPEHVQEGLNAGALYYLEKPCDPDLVISVVTAAIRQRRRALEMAEQVKECNQGIQLVRKAELQLRTMQEAKAAANFIANLASEPVPVMVGSLELLINAIEHGNLEIGREFKASLDSDEAWIAEVVRRQALPENSGKYVDVAIRRDSLDYVLTISDQGVGFDWEPYLDATVERAFGPYGRGIATAKHLVFKSLEYLGAGNCVEARFPCRLQGWEG